jgi:hypothetical protein
VEGSIKMSAHPAKNVTSRHCGRDIQDESIIRKRYVTRAYDETMSTIKTKLSDNYIWVSADETTDILVKGRYVVNVVVGILNPQIPCEPFLISTEFRSSVNAEEIYEIIKQAIAKVSNSGDEKLLMFISDAAAVMLKTGRI